MIGGIRHEETEVPDETEPSDPAELTDEDEITEEDSAESFAEQNDELPPVKYISRTYDESAGEVVDTQLICTDYIKMSSLPDNGPSLQDGKWYVVDKNITFNTRINVNSLSNIILVDGTTLTCADGIHVGKDGEIRIYGQVNDNGLLKTETFLSDNSPLGGNSNEEAGKITIYGGAVDSLALSGRGAAIGGGNAQNPGTSAGSPYWVKIYGGRIKTTGTDGAGIGNGHESQPSEHCPKLQFLLPKWQGFLEIRQRCPKLQFLLPKWQDFLEIRQHCPKLPFLLPKWQAPKKYRASSRYLQTKVQVIR